LHDRTQCQQLIVWRLLQPRSQLIKVFAASQADEQMPWALAQQTIQCYTQNEVAGAARTPARESDNSYGRKIGDGGTASRKSFEDDSLDAVKQTRLE
jgi:hypothetical protein